jgi:hypothetical protein
MTIKTMIAACLARCPRSKRIPATSSPIMAIQNHVEAERKVSHSSCPAQPTICTISALPVLSSFIPPK